MVRGAIQEPQLPGPLTLTLILMAPGFSLGSAVAQTMAVQYPEKVTSLVLFGSTFFSDNAALNELHNELIKDEEDSPIPAEFVEDLLNTMVEKLDDIPSWYTDILLHEGMKPTRRSLLEALQSLLVNCSSKLDLEVISVPTRVVRGEHDLYITEEKHRRLFLTLTLKP